MGEPSVIFVVPYRGRPEHKVFFRRYLSSIMEAGERASGSWEVYFSTQEDARVFNRGACKNIGFLAMKAKYPETYKDKTFVFNDVDTIPYADILDYATTRGVVKHFYGFKYALGGIVSFLGSDFERTNGFPNFFGWGSEDTVLQARCDKVGLTIDRSVFYPLGSREILHLFDGVSRIINARDPWRAKHDNGVDGIRSIYRLAYGEESEGGGFWSLGIRTFMTGVRFESESYSRYDLREPARKIVNPRFLSGPPKGGFITDDWSKIPFYPDAARRAGMVRERGEAATSAVIEASMRGAYGRK
jgi:hypothetical protein